MKSKVLLGLMPILLGACGVIYNPQSVSGYYNAFDYESEQIIAVTAQNVRDINRDNFQPKPFPQGITESAPAPDFPSAELKTLSGHYQAGTEANILSFDAPGVAAPRVTQPDAGQLAKLTDFQQQIRQGSLRSDLAEFQRSLSRGVPSQATSIEFVHEPGTDSYSLSPGDTVRIYERPAFMEVSGEVSPGTASNFEIYTIDALGKIYFGNDLSLDVSGMTVSELNRSVAELFADFRPDVNVRAEIDSFQSQFVTFVSDTGSSVIEIKYRNLRLLDVLGAVNASPRGSTVYLFRNSRAYSVNGDQLLANPAKFSVGLFPNDLIYLSDPRSVQATAEFLSLEQIKNDIANKAHQLDLSITRFMHELDESRLAHERWNAGHQLALNQYNQSLREHKQSINQYNQSERVRVQNERLQQQIRESEIARENFLKEFEYKVEQQHRTQGADEERFYNMLDRNLLDRDSLTLTGEFKQKKAVFLPFDRYMTVSEAVNNSGEGYNVITADPSRIFIFRTYENTHGSFDTYQIDATEPSGMIAMQLMQVRPDDIVYIDTQPITDFARVLNQIRPVGNFGTRAVGLF